MAAETEVLSVIDAIRGRHSVRRFLGPLPPNKRDAVTRAITEALALPRPFGTNAAIADHPPGLGRLGIVSREAGWLIGTVPANVTETRLHILDLGFLLHEALIRLAQHRIATVWWGMFNPSLAERSTPGFKVAAAIAYGEDAGQQGMVICFLSWLSGSKTRYPLERLFFDGTNGRPFTEENAGEFLELLKVVQSGPSDINKQSWRLVLFGSVVHVYHASSSLVTLLDIGIALANIEAYSSSVGKRVEYAVVSEPPASPLGGAYVVTVTINNA
jgi:hypothetical protein